MSSIFLNSAGASLMPNETVKVIKDHIDLECKVGGYEAQRLKGEEIEKVYDTLARFLNCSAFEVAILENATQAWCIAVQAIGLQHGDEIITVKSEYVSNYMMFLHLQEEVGVKINIVSNDDEGEIDVEQLESFINDKTRLISIPHVPTNSGRINDVEKIGQIERPKSCYYLVDACQSAGQIPLDVSKINCDFLSATSRKFIRGPRGIGFLYVNKNRLADLTPNVVDLRSATFASSRSIEIEPSAKKFENKEQNIANVLGFGKSLEIAMEVGLDSIHNTTCKLSEYLRNKLSEINGLTVHADCKDQCAIVTFYVENIPSKVLIEKLREKNIQVALIDPAGAILDSEENNLPEMVRAAPHYNIRFDELDKFRMAVQEIVDTHAVTKT